ncbi:MAG: amidohydrolase family protein [Brevefilum sp.]
MKKIIRTRRLLDCTGSPVKKDWSLIVEDGEIVQMGPSKEIDEPNLPILDMTNGFVMPGFIDMHAHFCYTEDAEFQQSNLNPNKVKMLNCGLRNAEEWLYQGVTTARIVGTPFDLDLELNNVLKNRPELGPRLVCAGHMMTMVGGCRVPWDKMKEEINGPNEALTFTRKHLARGVDVIKLYMTTLLEENVADYLERTLSLPDDAPDTGRWGALTEDEIRAVCDEVHKVGRTVSAHVAPEFGIKIALKGGVDTIEHGSDLDDECIALFLETGATLVPTLEVSHHQFTNPDMSKAPAVFTKFALKRWERQKTMLKKAYQSNVKIATGTDSVMSGMHYFPEVELLVHEIDMTPQDALLCATRNGAAAMGIKGEKIGTLEVGKFAD